MVTDPHGGPPVSLPERKETVISGPADFFQYNPKRLFTVCRWENIQFG